MFRRMAGPAAALVVLLVSVSTAGAQEMARLFDADVGLYVELSSTTEALRTVDLWLGPMAKGGRNPLQDGYEELGNLMGVQKEQVPEEIKKAKGAAMAFIGFNADVEEPEMLIVLDTGASTALLEGIKKGLLGEDFEVAEKFQEVSIYTGENVECPGAVDGVGYCAFVDSLMILGPSKEAVKDVVARQKGQPAKPVLSADPNFQAAVAKLEKNRVLWEYASMAGLKKVIQPMMATEEGEGNADAVWKAADLDSIEYAVVQFYLKGDRSLESGYVKFKPASRLMNLIRTPAAPLPLLKRVPADFPLVMGTHIADGKAQYEQFIAYVKGIEDAAELAQDDDERLEKQVADLEADTGIKMDEAVANLSEVVFAVRMPSQATGWQPAVLVLAEVRDPVKARELAGKIEKQYLAGNEGEQMKALEYQGITVHYPEADGEPVEQGLCYAFDANVWMAASNRQFILDAIKASANQKSIADNAIVAKSMESLPPAVSKLVLFDFLGMIPPDALPGGMRPGRAVLAFGMVDGTDEMTFTGDLTGFSQLMPLFMIGLQGMQGMGDGGGVQ